MNTKFLNLLKPWNQIKFGFIGLQEPFGSIFCYLIRFTSFYLIVCVDRAQPFLSGAIISRVTFPKCIESRLQKPLVMMLLGNTAQVCLCLPVTTERLCLLSLYIVCSQCSFLVFKELVTLIRCSATLYVHRETFPICCNFCSISLVVFLLSLLLD